MNIEFVNEVKELSSKLQRDSQNITFTLDFNQKYSLFYLNETLSTNKNLAVSFSRAKKPILSDLNLQKHYQYSPYSLLFLEDEFTVEYNSIEWNLLNETKLVDNKKLYKAVGNYKVLIKNEVTTQKLVAWYCPEIQLSIGPRGTSGLPGLVYILEDRYGAFIIKSIKMMENVSINNEDFIKNETINEDNFYELFIERKKIFNEKYIKS